MAKVTIKALSPGTKETRTGSVTVTRQRCRHYADQFRQFKERGIRVPAVWGHQFAAMPVTAGGVDDAAYKAARFNAGYVEDARIDPADGGLLVTADVPGAKLENGKLLSVATLADGTPVTTAIAEVSPMIGGSWKDGTGKVWDDIFAHLALTPYPVQAGQPGFAALATAPPGDPPAGFFYFAAPPLKDDKK